MPVSVHLDRGQGPVVVLLHGVGVGPESFAHLAEFLEDRHRVVVLGRPGGGGGFVSLVEQGEQVVKTMHDLGATGGLLVGVSGGATLGLLIAGRHPGLAAGYVLHEPLVGSLAPSLDRRFHQAAELAARSEADAMEVVRSVMGAATWDALGVEARSASLAQAPRWQAEIAAFAAFDPPAESIAGLAATPVLVTVGGTSGPERHEAAEVLRTLAGAEVAVIADAGNAVQIDQPEAFATRITSWRHAPIGGTP